MLLCIWCSLVCAASRKSLYTALWCLIISFSLCMKTVFINARPQVWMWSYIYTRRAPPRFCRVLWRSWTWNSRTGAGASLVDHCVMFITFYAVYIKIIRNKDEMIAAAKLFSYIIVSPSFTNHCARFWIIRLKHTNLFLQLDESFHCLTVV